MSRPSASRRRLGGDAAHNGQPPARRDGDSAATGEAILAATERLLGDRSLDELTVVDIIEAAGVSRATFYLYFQSKHAAVAELAHHVVEDIYRNGFAPWISLTEPLTEELVSELWRHTIAGWQAHRPVLLAAAQGWRTHSTTFERWGTSFRSYVTEVGDFITAARAAGSVPAGIEADGLAASLVWMSENMMYLSLTGDAPEFVDDKKLASTIAAMWIRAIYGVVPGQVG